MTRRTGQQWQKWWHGHEGRVSAFVVTLMVGLLGMAGLSLDGGLALASKVRASGQAESAARAGAQALDLGAYRASGDLALDPAQARGLAQRYLAGCGAVGTVEVAGDTVTVRVTTTYHPQLLSLVGVTTIRAHGHGAAHPQRGVTTIEP